MTERINGSPVEDGMYGSVDEEDYHRDRGSLSSSGARLIMRPGGPAKFRERMDHPPKPKKEFTFGHAAHRVLLGKGNDLVEITEDNYNKKAAQEARDAAFADDKVPVLSKQLAQVHQMAEVVKGHPDAGPLFHRGHAEVSFYTTDVATDVRLRCRCDWMTLVDERLTIVDYKTSTTANPSDFERKSAEFGYHCQGAFYGDVVSAVKETVPDFVLVIQEKDSPYLVSVVRPDALAIDEGRRHNRGAIDLYAHCMKTGEWPGYPLGITPISLPLWALEQEITI